MNYAVYICYNGTAYHGFQFQSGEITVNGEIRRALSEIFESYTGLTGCSRTDCGVHANKFCFSFSSEKEMPCSVLIRALNNKLPTDIRAFDAKNVDDGFHARYSVKSKEYIYKIYNHEISSPFAEGLSFYFPYKLNIEELNKIACLFVGKHDFSSFRAVGSKIKDPVRTVYSAVFEKQGEYVVFRISGDGFLYKMVRLIVGALLMCARGKLTPDDITAMLNGRSNNIPYTVPACGLYLNEINYD